MLELWEGDSLKGAANRSMEPLTFRRAKTGPPAAIAAASGDALGHLGIVRQRQAALAALTREVVAARLALHAGADVAATIAVLQALPGIGDWTAQYIAMRALHWPDAFPSGDIALQKALGVSSARAAAEA